MLVDGEPRRACLLPLAYADGGEITTVEGLGTPEDLSPIQQAFVHYYAAQCGFCTSGMMLAGESYIAHGGTDDAKAIQEALGGHVCRCTGYAKIVEAVARGGARRLVRPHGDRRRQVHDDDDRRCGMKVVGARIPRYDGIAHVTGRTTYVDDVRIPGTLWVKALRSPHHSARILKMDTKPAEDMPGVHAVVTHADVPLNEYGHLSALGIPADEPLLAVDEVRYKGQPIAVVAADDEATAAEAVDRIDIEFEERAAFTDVRKAFDSDAPKIHQWGNWYPHFEGEMDRRQIRKGDIDWAFENADTIVQGVYRPAAIEHAPIETQVCQVVPEPNGRLTIYSCTQALYFSMGVVAAHLQVPLNKLKFVGGTTGGGFGGKVDTATETMCCAARMKSGRPVKWRWTREEEFLCSSTRAPWHMEVADAVTKDGWILGRKMLTLHDAGAYARFSPYGLTKHSFHHTGAYTIPNLEFDGYVVFTNRVPTTAMRGFGVTSVSFATETHMSRIADVLGLDPIEIRLKNANRVGDTSPNGVVYTDPSTVLDDPGDRGGDRPPAAGRVRVHDERAPSRRVASRAPRRRRSETRRTTSHGQAHGPRDRGDRVPDGDEPERRPVAGVDQGEARRAHRRLRRDVRHRQRVEDDPVADRRRDDRRALRLDHVRQLEHGLVADVHGHVRVARDLRRGQGGREGGAPGEAEAARDRGQGARDRPRGSRDRRRRGDREGRAADEAVRRGRGRSGDVHPRRAHHRHGRAAQAVRRDRRPGDGRGRPRRPTRRSRTRRARPRSRWTTRPAR